MTTARPRPETVAGALRSAAAGRDLWLDVAGGSMGRAVAGGGSVLVGGAGGRPRVGEVWAFCDAEGRVVVHRCRGGGPGTWVFEGDAVGRRDRPVPEDLLIGRVRAVRDPGGAVRPLGRADRWRGTVGIGVRRARRFLRRSVR